LPPFSCFIFNHSLLGLICVPSVVRPFREDKLLVGTTFLQEKREKFTLRTAKCRGRFVFAVGKRSGVC
jgi:hypothetical protein